MTVCLSDASKLASSTAKDLNKNSTVENRAGFEAIANVSVGNRRTVG